MLEPETPVVLKRGIRRGLLTLFRERGWKSSLGALFGVFLLLQLLLFVLLGLEGVQTMLRERTELRLEVLHEATNDDIQLFYSALQQLPYVASTHYMSKEQVFEKNRATEPELIAFLETYALKNPYSDAVIVTLANLNDYERFAAFVKGAEWHSVIDPAFLSTVAGQEKRIFGLLKIAEAGRTVTVLILALTAVSLVFITTELIRRRVLARSDEVLVERLVGASQLSILVPFVTEAVVLFLVAVVLSTAVVLGLAMLLPSVVPALSPRGALGPYAAEVAPLLATVLPVLLLLEFLVMPFIAWAGAWLGTREQIRSPRMTLIA